MKLKQQEEVLRDSMCDAHVGCECVLTDQERKREEIAKKPAPTEKPAVVDRVRLLEEERKKMAEEVCIFHRRLSISGSGDNRKLRSDGKRKR